MHAARAIVAGLLCLGAILWAAGLIRQDNARRQFEAVRRQGEAAVLSAVDIPTTAEALRLRAQFREEKLFPADRAGAIADLRDALLIEPMRSGLWFLLSRNLLFTGDSSGARVALSRADELDPRYPRQRLRAIQLWSLLGERQKVEDLARDVSGLGQIYRLDAARQLVEMGLPVDRVYELVQSTELSPVERGELLERLRSRDRPALGRVFDAIPPAAWDTPDFRLAALARASDPLLYDVARRAWEAEGIELLDRADVIVYTNPDLAAPPFSSALALGWLPFAPRGGESGSWSAPGLLHDDPHGVMAIRFAPPLREREVNLRYRFLRLPYRSAEPLLFRVRVRPTHPGQTSGWLLAAAGETATRGRSVDLAEGWQELAVMLPPVAEPTMLEITLDARFTRRSLMDDPMLYLGPIGFGAETSYE